MDEPVKFQFEQGVVNEETKQYAKIELGKCYETIISILDYYMDIPKDETKIIALWIIGTYLHGSFNAYPYLFFNAMRGSGKTRLLKIISHLSKGGNGKVRTGITESVLFRMPKGTTLVLDEMERIGGKDKEALREYLNACYKKGGFVDRMKKGKMMGQDEWITESFEPYKPVAMANIYGMDEVLGDRCISIVLEKSGNPEKTKKQEDFENNPVFKKLRETLKFVQVTFSDVTLLKKTYRNEVWNNWIHKKYTNTETSLYVITSLTSLNNTEIIEIDTFFNKIDSLDIDGRNLELIFPFLIISDLLDPFLLDEILIICKKLIDSKKDDELMESRDASLFEFVLSLQSKGLNWIDLKELTNGFRSFMGEDHEWLNDKWLGRGLKRLGLTINKRKLAQGRQVILNFAKAQEKLKIFKKDEQKH